MTTISVPIPAEQEKFIKEYIKSGKADNKAQVVRRALREFEEMELLRKLQEIEREPILRGDLDELVRKLK